MSRTVNFLKEDTNLFAGTALVIPLRVVDDDNGEVPLDISAWTFQFDMNDDERNPDGANIIQKTSGSGIDITDGVNGLLTVTVDPADTSGAGYKTEHNHYWSLVRLTPLPVTMLGEGRIYVKGSPFQA